MTATTTRSAPPPPVEGPAARRADYGSLVVLLVTTALATASMVVADLPALPAGVRAGVAVLAACTLPGLPVVALLRPDSRALAVALVTGVSLAVTVLVPYALLLAGIAAPRLVQAGIAAAACGLAVLAVVRTRRRRPRRAPDPADRRPHAEHRAAMLAVLALALALFGYQVAHLDLAGVGTAGIITQVGWPYAAALLAAGGVVAVTLARPRIDHVVMTAAVVVLAALTTQLVPAVSGEPSVPTAYVHRGFADMILVLGELPPPIDARISWAGFFTAGAHLTAVAGLPEATVFLAPAPLVVAALMVAPLYVLGRALTGSARLAWGGVVIYLLANWYQQDYFAPQALALLWHTTVLATVLHWWRQAPGPRVSRPHAALRRTTGRPPGAGLGAALATEAVLVVLVVATVVTHQLTPLVTIGSLLVLTVTGTTRFRLLWLAATIAFVAWFTFGAEDFWRGNLAMILDDLGTVGDNVAGGVTERLRGVPDHDAGQYVRIASSGAFAVLAAAGWWARRHRRGAPAAALLAAVPLALVAAQSYGGEVVLRVFVLASPVLAPLAAVAVGRLLAAVRPRAAATVLVALSCAVGGLVLTSNRGLNTAFEVTWDRERAVVDHLVDTVPEGTTIASWGMSPYLTDVRAVEEEIVVGLHGVNPQRCAADPVRCTLEVGPDYLVLTPTDEAEGVLRQGRPPGWMARGREIVEESGWYEVIVDEPSITVLRHLTPEVSP